MGITTSISIPASVTPSVAPANTALPTQEVVVEGTAQGGIRVVEVKEPIAPVADPNLILGKFKTQEDLIAAYKELESGKGKKADEVLPTPETSTTLNIESAAKTLTDKGLDYNKFALQYAKDGALNSESYQELFSKGITAQQIDAFIVSQAPLIASQKAAAEVAAKDVMDHVGGADEFAKLTGWAAKTLTPAELSSYNRAVDAGDVVGAKILLSNFKGKYDAALGKEPNLNGGTPPAAGATDTYQEISQYHSDLRDPRYDKDSFFRSKIDKKLERSRNLYVRA